MTKTVVVMDTFVTINVVAPDSAEADAAMSRAFEWFNRVEACCSRFDDGSEVRALVAKPGVAVPVSTMLFEAVQFAVAVAEESGGAFDPTVGRAMEQRGFNREYSTGRLVDTTAACTGDVSYRDVYLDGERLTITLARPLVLDLGAVAKGLAIDMAAKELAAFENFAIDAGGDVYVSGANADRAPWVIGIRHPREANAVIETLRVSNTAVCTSGDYERRASGGSHLVDPRSGVSPAAIASATVVAPRAMLADALATAAFVLGPEAGIELLNRHGVAGLLVTTELGRHVTNAPLQPLEVLHS